MRPTINKLSAARRFIIGVLRNDRMKLAVLIVGCAFVLLCGVLFWPTLYRYDTVWSGSGMTTITDLVRTNRLTRESEWLVNGVWMTTQQRDRYYKAQYEEIQREKAQRASRELPSDMLRKLTGNARLTRQGSFVGKLYNGSDWRITRVILDVVAKEQNGKVRWDRRFTWSPGAGLTLNPLSVMSFSVDVAADYEVGSTQWSIVTACGHPPTGSEAPEKSTVEQPRWAAPEKSPPLGDFFSKYGVPVTSVNPCANP